MIDSLECKETKLLDIFCSEISVFLTPENREIQFRDVYSKIFGQNLVGT